MEHARKQKIDKEFFHRRVDLVAKDLLGKTLLCEKDGHKVGGKIVETEAYLGREDPASHLVKAGEKRQRIFEKGAGTVYVFKIYHHKNLNFLTEHDRVTEGVLIRALEPSKGIETMKKRRGVNNETEVASGPGKLTEALGIEKEEENGLPLKESPLSIHETHEKHKIKRTGRIGISEAEEWPLRFTVKDNKHVSRPKDRPVDESFRIEKFYR